MKLKLVPYHMNCCSCFEDILVSVARWKGIPYEPIFYKSWSFQYYKEREMESIGERIAIWRALDRITENKVCSFMGMYFERIDVSSQDFLAVIAEYLYNMSPVVIEMDAYYVPWNPHYKKLHVICDFLIIGYEDGTYMCVDPYVSTTLQYLKENILDSVPKSLIVFKFTSRNEEVDMNEILKLSIRNTLFNAESQYNDFEQMRQLADDMRHELIFQEMGSSKHIEETLIVKKLKLLEMSRIAFKEFVNICPLQNEVRNRMKNDFEIAGLMWGNIKCMLIKFRVRGYDSNVLGRAKEKIREVASIEEKMAKNFLEMLK